MYKHSIYFIKPISDIVHKMSIEDPFFVVKE